MSKDAPFLREQAKRCRRLAEMTLDPDLIKRLLAMAIDYDERADVLEREAAGKPPTINC